LAGLLALLAGVLAYVAGKAQAIATKDSTDRQLSAQTAAQAVEVKNIKSAVRTEVIAFTKLVIGAMENCRSVATGAKVIPMSDANAIVRGLQEPNVFPAVADRIAILDNPHIPIQFYLRIEEAKSIANSLSIANLNDPLAKQLTNVTAYVTRDNAEAIADCLLTALQLSDSLINDFPVDSSEMEKFVTNETLKSIQSEILAARAIFPGAESFKVPW
jgi:hypothetical protein